MLYLIDMDEPPPARNAGGQPVGADTAPPPAPEWLRGFCCGAFSTLFACFLIAFLWWVF
ncbi:MAG: hypothetical protein ACP5SH_09975 [Syntrophobacteraceae bacterium]